MIVKDYLYELACPVFKGLQGFPGGIGPAGDPGPRGSVVSKIVRLHMHNPFSTIENYYVMLDSAAFFTNRDYLVFQGIQDLR